MLLITKVKAKTKIIVDNNKVWFFKINEKIIVLGFFAKSSDTPTIPQKPKIKITGKTIKNAFLKPISKSLLDLAEKTLCQVPWSNKFVAKTAIKKVIPAVYP